MNNRRKPLIMGILNMTPDSFSDGGVYNMPVAAVAHAGKMVAAGADMIDIGGESTRPGSSRVSATEQLARTIDVVAACRQQYTVDLSIDTTKACVAERALDAGASFINDVSAATDDPDMLALVAERNVRICLMHMQGNPQNMQHDPVYDDVVEDIKRYLLERVDAAMRAGVGQEQLVLDPGIGFGKTRQHNLQLLNQLHQFVSLGFTVLLGTSRKRFMGAICAETQPDQLVGATVATTAIGTQAGVHIFRVHDVKENRQAADTSWAISNIACTMA